MCGISGYWSLDNTSPAVLSAMNQALTLRGPDAEGVFEQGPIHLGHRRLSVIDLAGGTQPMLSTDQRLALVFNGEIYNYRILRTSLQQLGHTFVTLSDTEVLLHAYREYGHLMLCHLHGMFAFAIWDAAEQTLFAARDHLGVKPFYYYWDGKTFAFASELKAILANPAVKREVNLNAVGLFLECQYIPAPMTIYRHIYKLEAGHTLQFRHGQLQISRYWIPDYRHKLVLSEYEALDALEQRLRDSVTGMLIADVPLGAFVSGGIDSSLIAAMMSDISAKPVDTFTVGFHGSTCHSEHLYAEQVTQHIGGRHHCLMLTSDDVIQAFDRWVDVFDEPFADQAALPTLLLSQLAKRHVTVVLTGEGADELFCGYTNYTKRVKEERISAILGHPASPLRYLLSYLPPQLRKDRLLRAITEPLARRYRTIPNIFDTYLHPTLFTPDFLAAQQTDMGDYAEHYYRECNSAHYIDRLMYVDARLWLADDLLTKVDRATMAYSLEARVPYLDHRFFEFSAQLDPALKYCHGIHKYLLKKLAERYLPHSIVHRPKQGFVMPLSEWLAHRLKPMLEAALAKNALGRRGLFRKDALIQLLVTHQNGSKNHSGRLWALMVLEHWFSRYEPSFAL